MKPEEHSAAAIADTPQRTLRAAPSAGGIVEQVIVKRSRLVDKDVAAQYLGISVDTVERLIHTGQLPIVKLPVERAKNGDGQVGASRRVLIDVRDLDALIERSKETQR